MANECFLLLENGKKILKESGDGFLLLEHCDEEYVGGGGQGRQWGYAGLEQAYSNQIKAREAEEAKQQEILRLKIEAQELLVKKEEIKSQKDKQTKRQLAALESKYQELLQEEREQLRLLDEMQQAVVRQRNLIIFLLLQASCPLN
jgi:hypothetical protein